VNKSQVDIFRVALLSLRPLNHVVMATPLFATQFGGDFSCSIRINDFRNADTNHQTNCLQQRYPSDDIQLFYRKRDRA